MTETIVNRVSSPGLDADLREAGLETAETLVSQPETPVFVEGIGETMVKPEVYFSPELISAAREVMGLPRHTLMERVRRDDAQAIAEFADRVVKAFRHMGLDTTKFFEV